VGIVLSAPHVTPWRRKTGGWGKMREWRKWLPFPLSTCVSIDRFARSPGYHATAHPLEEAGTLPGARVNKGRQPHPRGSGLGTTGTALDDLAVHTSVESGRALSSRGGHFGSSWRACTRVYVVMGDGSAHAMKRRRESAED
jgi:hypothetical protein